MNRRTQFNQKIKRLTCFRIRPPSPYFSRNFSGNFSGEAVGATDLDARPGGRLGGSAMGSIPLCAARGAGFSFVTCVRRYVDGQRHALNPPLVRWSVQKLGPLKLNAERMNYWWRYYFYQNCVLISHSDISAMICIFSSDCTFLRFYSWPHTPNPWGHVELVQKTRGLGSGNWVRLRSAKSDVRSVDTIWEPHYIYYITLILLVMKNLLGYIGSLPKKKVERLPDTTPCATSK